MHYNESNVLTKGVIMFGMLAGVMVLFGAAFGAFYLCDNIDRYKEPSGTCFEYWWADDAQ